MRYYMRYYMRYAARPVTNQFMLCLAKFDKILRTESCRSCNSQLSIFFAKEYCARELCMSPGDTSPRH